jgi:hypothetical protein
MYLFKTYFKGVFSTLLMLLSATITNAQLTIFENQGQSGTQGTCVSSTIYKGSSVPQSLDNQISSIQLQQGFMATLAENEDGSGNRYTFIASVSNVTVNLSAQLNDKVSFIRVLPFINTLKKGVGFQDNTVIDNLNVSWFYDWGSADISTVSREYSPMSWGKAAASVSKIPDYISKGGVNTLLSFNEPDNSGQSNVDVQTAVHLHENLAATGYRLGSPACEEANATGANKWLTNFMTSANLRNIKVDYIAVHWYDWGSYSSTNNTAPNVANMFTRFKNYINNIYSTYNKPIWITEFNANPNTTSATHEAFIALVLPWLEQQPFIERYAYFFPPALPPMSAGVLTPIGNAYKNQSSSASFTTNKDNSEVTGIGNSRYVYEAENATLTGASLVSCTNASGGSMTGAVTGSNNVSFQNITVPFTGNYNLDISFYAKTGRTGIQVKVNGGTAISLDFPASGNWCYETSNNIPAVYETIVTLNAGNNIIEFSESSILDKIKLIGIIGTLPIKLVDFSGESRENGVKLNWETAQEVNNQYFEILRSMDGVSFSSITKVNGAINSTENKRYSFMDYNVQSGTNYYQLKQVDTDGKFTISNTIAVNMGLQDESFKVVSATDKEIAVAISLNKALKGQITYTQLNGKVLFKQIYNLNSGYNAINISVLLYPNQIGIVSFFDGANLKSIKILR